MGAEIEPDGPALRLEYVPGGSLSDHLQTRRLFSSFECGQVLHQCLSALVYIHGLDPSVVHRDIGLNNILVQYRRPDAIFVKFADFGLAKEGADLQTICGNMMCLAPELYTRLQANPTAKRSEELYTTAIDIWSLGVVFAELLCGLPPWRSEYQYCGTVWCDEIREKLARYCRRHSFGLGWFVLDTMLRINPGSRQSAQACHDGVLPLANGIRGSSGPLTSDGTGRGGSELSTVRLSVKVDGDDGGSDGQNTVIFRGTSPVEETLSNLDSSSLDAYLTGLPNARWKGRSDAPPLNSTHAALARKAGALVRQAEVERLVNNFSDPEHPHFLGSVVEGAGINFDFEDGTSQVSEDARQGEEQIDDGSDPVGPGGSLLVPSPTEASRDSHRAEVGMPAERQEDGTRSEIWTLVRDILGPHMRGRSAETAVPDMSELPREPDGASAEGLQIEPQPRGAEARGKRKRTGYEGSEVLHQRHQSSAG